MEILLAFAVGYVVGAQAGSESFQDVVDSYKAVRESEEFRSLLKALRDHAGSTLEEVGGLLRRGTEEEAGDVLARVRDLVRRVPTSPAS